MAPIISVAIIPIIINIKLEYKDRNYFLDKHLFFNRQKTQAL
nr:MAG TPA: hypothetical protein [Caudoviricetes sp.]